MTHLDPVKFVNQFLWRGNQTLGEVKTSSLNFIIRSRFI